MRRTTPAPGTVQAGQVRSDRGALLRSVRTPEGYIFAEGFAARPGVMTYRDGDREWRELVPAEELHRADSLSTLAGKPLTVEHPPDMVTPDNVAEFGAGDVGDEVTVADNGFVRVKMAARRRDALDAVDGGKVELSPGYTCDVEWTPGEHPEWGHYDAIQRNRRYNHLALVDVARGGAQMRIRIDGAAEQVDAPQPIQGEEPASESAEESDMEKLIALLVAAGLSQEAAAGLAPKIGEALAGQSAGEAESEGESKVEIEVGADAQGAEGAPDYKAMYEDACAKLEALKADMSGMVKADSIPALVSDLASVRTVATAWGIEHGDHAADKLRALVVEKAKPGALRKDAAAAEVRAAFAMLPESPASASAWSSMTSARNDSASAAPAGGGFTRKIGGSAGKES